MKCNQCGRQCQKVMAPNGCEYWSCTNHGAVDWVPTETTEKEAVN